MRFTKMHGLGNDYIYMCPEEGNSSNWAEVSRRLSDRHFGVGADGIILALPSGIADLKMRIFNSDGSEAEMCGNGIRCLGRYAVEEGLVRQDANSLKIETLAGVLELELIRENDVVTGARVAMGEPAFHPASLPVLIEGSGPISGYQVEIDDFLFDLTFVSMGNPHAIHWLTSKDPDDLENFPLDRLGPLLENHSIFPNRTNVQIVQVLDREHVRHRVWERGSGLTLASGTSASAVCAAGRMLGFTGDRIVDSLPGGDLLLEWDGIGPVYMTGPAERVFDGEWTGI